MRLTSVARHRNAAIGLVLSFALFSVGLVLAQQNPPAQNPPAQQTPPAAAQQQQPAAPMRVFTTDTGMVVNYIKADKTSEFEALVAKLKEGLLKSENPERKQMAAGWKVFKASEPGPNGSVIYFFYIDPVVKGADYTMSKLMYEAFPAETQDLYKRISESFVGTTMFNMALVSTMSQ